MWGELWKMPQAVEWDRLGQVHIVGLFVRRLVESEAPDARVTLTTVVRQLADGLGLTTAGMRANRWRIGDAVAPSTGVERPTSSATGSRARLRVVDTDGGAS